MVYYKYENHMQMTTTNEDNSKAGRKIKKKNVNIIKNQNKTEK